MLTHTATPQVTHADVVQVMWKLVRAKRTREDLTEEELRLQLERTYQRCALACVVGGPTYQEDAPLWGTSESERSSRRTGVGALLLRNFVACKRHATV